MQTRQQSSPSSVQAKPVTTKKKLAFIINPVAGISSKVKLPQLIEHRLDHNKFEIEILKTTYAGEAKSLAKSSVLKGYHAVIAIGGDGTVNEIASQLVGTNTILGIIPSGSGNGLARKLGISRAPHKALDLISAYKIQQIDVGLFNKNYFFSNAGVGYEGLIAEKYSKVSKGGFWQYAKLFAQDYFLYKENNYTITTNKGTYKSKAFQINFTNSGQYGYNLGPAPLTAQLDDGFFELCIVDAFPKLYVFWMTFLMILQKTHLSRYVRMIKVKRAEVRCDSTMQMQIDGEAGGETNVLEVKVLPKGLKVIVP